MKKSLNITFVLVAFVVGFLFSPAIVSRADGGDLSLIHACVKDKGGDVKIVGANSGCPSGYSPLHWSIVGPQGPQGIQGPPGPASLPTAYSQTIDSNFMIVGTHSPDFTTLGTFDLPAGKWALFVTVNISLSIGGNPYSAVSCQIPEVPGMSVKYGPGDSAGTEIRLSLQMQNFSRALAGTQTLTLQCTISDGWWDGGPDFRAQGASLMAIQVAP